MKHKNDSLLRLHDHTQTHHTWWDSSGRVNSPTQRSLYVTTNNTHNRQISMSPEGFEPAIPAGERPQTLVLDRMATGTG